MIPLLLKNDHEPIFTNFAFPFWEKKMHSKQYIILIIDAIFSNTQKYCLTQHVRISEFLESSTTVELKFVICSSPAYLQENKRKNIISKHILCLLEMLSFIIGKRTTKSGKYSHRKSY